VDQQTAMQHAAIGARYVKYCERANPDPNSPTWGDFHAAMAMAVSYSYLDLRDLTPFKLIEPMLAQLREWQASGLSANTLSAQDRLNGLYGICANCGEFTPKEIGGLPVSPNMPHAVTSSMRHAATGTHVCTNCRVEFLVEPVLREVAHHA
jgi:hypothetical protein